VGEKLRAFEKARSHYDRFLERWRRCDERLKPVFEEGRQGLERLKHPPPS